MMHKAWSSIEEMPYCISRSYVKLQGHTALKIVNFDPNWAFPDCISSLKSPMATKWCKTLEITLKRCSIVFSCDQAALQRVLSVCLSVRLYVCHTFLAATKQLYERFSPSVRPFVCPSVTPFWLCSHHRIIMKFSGVFKGHSSNFKVTRL